MLEGPNAAVATVDLTHAPADQKSWEFEYLDGFGRPAAGVLIRLNTAPGQPPKYRAYRNLCPHWSMPLDAGTGEFFDDAGHMLLCKFHGARFEPATGECMMGPCDGDFLEELRIEVSADQKIVTIYRGRALKLTLPD